MRELRAVSDGTLLGTVDYVDGVLVLTGAADEVFAGLRRVLDDQKLGTDLVEHGWSNGYLYLTGDNGEGELEHLDTNGRLPGDSLVAHLPGKHDQSSHGKGGSPELLHDDEATINATYNYTDEKTGLTAEVSRIGDTPKFSESSETANTYVSIEIKDREGNVVGHAQRIIRPPDQRTVEHEAMVFGEAIQGQGFASRYNAHVESAYIDHGIEKIHLNANLDVGGYAWARAGYDFRGSDARAAVASHAREMGRKFTPDVQAQIRRVADNPSASPVDFAMIGHTPGALSWPGKEIMLEASWDGVKNLGPSGGFTQPELGG